MTGVVLSNHSGPTAGASGEIKLAVRDKNYSLYYDHSLQTRFTTDSCWSIGMVWSVEYRTLQDSSLYAERATCEGKANKAVYEAWLMLRKYLSGMDARPSASHELFSPLWTSSPAGKEYEKQAAFIDLTDYRRFGMSGTCIDVIGQQPGTILLEAGADCHLTLSKEPIDLILTMSRTNTDKRWQIYDIKLR